MVYKRRTCVKYDDAKDYLDGKIEKDGQLYNEIDWMKRKYFSLKPSIYLSCERDYFKGRVDESLRVTFDRQIRWQDARSGAYGERRGRPAARCRRNDMRIRRHGFSGGSERRHGHEHKRRAGVY